MNNMIKRFGVTFGLVGLFVLGACGTDEATKSAETAPSMEPVEAELNVPATADKDEAVTLAVRVTQDGKAVDDADEIKFEVWKNGAKEESETTEAALTEDGVYEAETTFSDEAVYTVQVHVTARSMHTMPTTNVTVGHPETAAEAEAEAEEDHHNHAGADIVLDPTQAVAKEVQPFTVNVEIEHEALTGADVQLEVFKDGADKHDWVKLDETEGGSYAGEHTFPEAGTYNVQVHVTKGHDIHEHIMETVEVK
ncbi:MAG: FixH family protein [Exiguobacterium chiriqhucha]|uniref:FixH family protein n=1 Tax=Exiguobacterium chiriqhucha TaxID=1385984 RepID=UPI00144C91CC|nr:FixH family protein [Exiguobacterium chiriqhucha]KAB2862558.1 MAG: FixH family protein [Exiguobacterium chiriqhucha]